MLFHMPLGSLPLGAHPDYFKILFPDTPLATEAEYFESFGRFIAAYALAEAGLHEVARLLSKLSEGKARVIFANMRLGDLTDRIRGMLRSELAEGDSFKEFDTCLVQLAAISDNRNKLIHRTVNFEG